MLESSLSPSWANWTRPVLIQKSSLKHDSSQLPFAPGTPLEYTASPRVQIVLPGPVGTVWWLLTYPTCFLTKGIPLGFEAFVPGPSPAREFAYVSQELNRNCGMPSHYAVPTHGGQDHSPQGASLTPEFQNILRHRQNRSLQRVPRCQRRRQQLCSNKKNGRHGEGEC